MSAAVALPDALAHVRAVVAQSGTSFGLGMRILPPERRQAMHAIYAFCREIDDIADEPAPLETKRAGLAEWRAEIARLYAGAPSTPTGVALLGPVQRFNLPEQEFLLLIEGMAWDAEGPIRAPSRERLLGYCRRVAGAVGMLSMPVFGAPPGPASDRFAIAMGEGLQLANIARDVGEDATDGRIYLPDDLLARFDLPGDPAALVRHPALPLARAALAADAQAAFARARVELATLDWRVLRPALVMHAVYARMLQALAQDGYRSLERPAVGKLSKVGAALWALLWPPRS